MAEETDNLLQTDLLVVDLRSFGIVMSVHSFSNSIDCANVPRSNGCTLRWYLDGGCHFSHSFVMPILE